MNVRTLSLLLALLALSVPASAQYRTDCYAVGSYTTCDTSRTPDAYGRLPSYSPPPTYTSPGYAPGVIYTTPNSRPPGARGGSYNGGDWTDTSPAPRRR